MPTTYQIAAVARRTGLSSDTIRAWERRYLLVQPSRSSAGIRLYSEGDVQRLELARAAVNLGHPIRRIAPLPDSELRDLVQTATSKAGRAGLRSNAQENAIEDMIAAIRIYDLNRAESLLSSAAMFFPPTDLIVDLLAPFMREIGVLWEDGSLSIAQEHFASHLVRNLLGSMQRLRPPSGNATMLFLTPPGESHEFGILFAACVASLHGVRAIILGSNIPVKEAVRAARAVAPQRILVGLLCRGERAVRERYIADLRRNVPSHIDISLGGAAAWEVEGGHLPVGVRIIADIAQFASELRTAGR